jgi:hypothetical protein
VQIWYNFTRSIDIGYFEEEEYLEQLIKNCCFEEIIENGPRFRGTIPGWLNFFFAAKFIKVYVLVLFLEETPIFSIGVFFVGKGLSGNFGSHYTLNSPRSL